jgi:hypothetical protein
MKAIKYLFILAVSASIFNSCTKDVAGPTGPTGAQGAQGASSSYTVAIDSAEPNNWSANNAISGFNFTINNISGLTNPSTSIVDVYYSTSLNKLSSLYYELPVASSYQTGDAFQYYFDTYSVTVQYIFATAPTQRLYFKVVVITQP